MSLPIRFPLEPMEADTKGALPSGTGWLYEPKWDGFRCLVFRDGDGVRLQSKSGKPLGRYFPDVVAAVLALRPSRFVLDGELVVPVDGHFSFDELLQRIHPAASRVRTLAATHPARLIVFDLLADERGSRVLDRPLAERVERLDRFAKRWLPRGGAIRRSRTTRRRATAARWLAGGDRDIDGVIAKRLDLPYRPGERDGMIKVKRERTADCVVGGFRRSSTGRGVGSLLLGLYDDDGRLDHVGFTSGFSAAERVRLLERLEPLIEPPGFTGNAPGGPSRWSTKRSEVWEPLRPELVVEVAYDHVTGGRFRHGTRLIRWRPDKAPRQCTRAQLES